MNIARLLLVLLLWTTNPLAQTVIKRRPVRRPVTVAQQYPRTPEEKTAAYFESLRKSPPQIMAFLRKMPKGADLHSHLSGAIYAESYVEWAADNGLCVNNTTMALSLPPCNPAQSTANSALTNPLLYRQMIDAWSMRNWQYSGQNGHDHFFDAFGKFGVATYNQTGKMLAEVVSRAAHGNVIYLELMLTPDGIASSQLGQKVGWDGNFERTLSNLKTNGIADAATTGNKNLQDAESEKDRLLKCGTPQADGGCAVTVRYIAQVSRATALGSAFAQMVTAFIMASDPTSKVVGVNLVQAEDSPAALQNFVPEMQMLNYLRPLYPKAHLSLHAGELAPGIVSPEDLSFHIRESIVTEMPNVSGTAWTS